MKILELNKSKERFELSHFDLAIEVETQIIANRFDYLRIKYDVSHQIVLTILALILRTHPTNIPKSIALEDVVCVKGVAWTVEYDFGGSEDEVDHLQNQWNVS
jgi:hypothetical protein